MTRLDLLARTICFAGLASLTAGSATPIYTIAFKSFAPNNSDLFVADAGTTSFFDADKLHVTSVAMDSYTTRTSPRCPTGAGHSTGSCTNS